MEPLHIVETAHLFPELHRELIALLRSLTPEDWLRPTVARGWCVRDVSAHLLDGDLRRLSFQRDRLPVPRPAEPTEGYTDLVKFLNKLNADWIRASQRISPQLLIQLLELTGPQVAALVASLLPHEPALFPVAWAGETQSENWFDIGREYTERWHHQAQIRDAVGAPLLDSRKWLHPVLELSLRALPVAFHDISAAPGTALVFQVTGDAGDTWSLVRNKTGWAVWRGDAGDPAARASCDADTAWRLFFNAMSPTEARCRIAAEGDADLLRRLVTVRAAMI